MAVAQRTVAFGSFFEITVAGRDELITQFKKSFPDGVSAPFVDYDESRHVFNCTSDDDHAINEFALHFKSYIEYEIKRAQAPRGDVENLHLIDSPRLVPLANTIIPNEQEPSHNGLLNAATERLVDFIDDSDDSSDDTSGSDSIFAYWEPKSGDISILTTETATAIANTTECFVWPESANKRVKLTSGNVQRAKDKLKRLEPLMEQLKRHREGSASPVDTIFLFTVSTLAGSGVCYVSTKMSPHSERLIVDTQLEANLEDMLIAEERIWTESGHYIRPENLKPMHSSVTATYGPSAIWNNTTTPEIGLVTNSLPRQTDVDHTKNTPQAAKLEGSPDAHETSKFLLPREQARVTAWTRAIDPEGDPKALPVVPVEPEEAEAKTGVQRLVEGSDDDEEAAVPQHNTTQPLNRVVASGSDESAVGELFGSKKAIEPTTKVQHGLVEEKANPRIRRRDRTAVPPPQPPPALLSHTFAQEALNSSATFFAGLPKDDVDKDVAQANAFSRGALPTSRVAKISAQSTRPSAYSTSDKLVNSAFEEELTQKDPRRSFTNLVSETAASVIPGAFQKLSLNETSDAKMQSVNRHSPKGSMTLSAEFEPSEKFTSAQHLGPRPENTTTRSPAKPSVSFDASTYEGHGRSLTGQTPISPHPRPNTARQNVIKDGFTHQQALRHRNVNALVDLDDIDQYVTKLEPPPGFEHRSLVKLGNTSKLEIMDTPLDNIQKPTLKPASPLFEKGQDVSSSTSGSSGARTLTHEHALISHLPKANIGGMRKSMINKLHGIPSGDTSIPLTAADGSISTQRIAADDETATRVYHQTMNLKAPNPGRSKKKNKGSNQNGQSQQVKPADRQAQIEKAMQQVDKLPVGSIGSKIKSPTVVSTQSDRPSKRLLEAAKNNPELAKLHKTSIQQKDRESQVIEFQKQLGNILDIARAFAGKLSFSMQLGQVLVPAKAKLSLDKVYEKDKWEKRFKQGPASQAVNFSKTLTDNGADMDRLLECKFGSHKIWSKKPTATSFTVEFHCQTQSRSGLKLVLNGDGQISVEHKVKTIGKIAISCPGRVWDGCAIIEGQHIMNETSEDIEEAIQQLRSTIYLAPSPKTTLYYRHPANGVLNVQHVRLQRLSLHKCLLEGESELSLKIVENKELLLQCHRDDKTLWKAFERDHTVMTEEGRILYEAGIVHERIDEALKDNQNLEIGELTAAETTGRSLLPPPPKTMVDTPLNEHRALLLLESTVRTIDRIDWMGQRNYSTLRRKSALQEEFERDIVANSHPLHSMVPRAPAAPFGRSTIGGSTRRYGTTSVIDRNATTPSAVNRQPIHGVRTGTIAELWRDSAGNFYYLGQGGARIPLTSDDVAVSSRDVVPDDSASQAGVPRTIRRRAPDPYDRGPGYW